MGEYCKEDVGGLQKCAEMRKDVLLLEIFIILSPFLNKEWTIDGVTGSSIGVG